MTLSECLLHWIDFLLKFSVRLVCDIFMAEVVREIKAVMDKGADKEHVRENGR